jgi:hypothetical protein
MVPTKNNRNHDDHFRKMGRDSPALKGASFSIKGYNNNQAFYSQASWGRLEMNPTGAEKQRQKQK